MDGILPAGKETEELDAAEITGEGARGRERRKTVVEGGRERT